MSSQQLLPVPSSGQDGSWSPLLWGVMCLLWTVEQGFETAGSVWSTHTGGAGAPSGVVRSPASHRLAVMALRTKAHAQHMRSTHLGTPEASVGRKGPQ